MTEQRPYRQQIETSSRKFIRYASVLLAISVVGLNWIATQRAAATLYYPPFLSGRLVAHVYQPFAWWSWEARWPHAALQVGRSIIPLQPIWHTCEYEVLGPLLVMGGIAVFISGILTKWRGTSDLHGTAGWAGRSEIRKAGLL